MREVKKHFWFDTFEIKKPKIGIPSDAEVRPTSPCRFQSVRCMGPHAAEGSLHVPVLSYFGEPTSAPNQPCGTYMIIMILIFDVVDF